MVLMDGSGKNILVFGVSSLIKTIFSYKVENGPKTSIFDLRFWNGSKRLVIAAFAQKMGSVIFPRSKTNRKPKKTSVVKIQKDVKNCIFWIFRRLQWCGSCTFYAYSSHLVVISKLLIIGFGPKLPQIGPKITHKQSFHCCRWSNSKENLPCIDWPQPW